MLTSSRTTLDLAKVEQIDSFKILEQSQQDLILTLANALRDDHDQFEAIAEHHAVSIQQLVQQEHGRTRALTVCEVAATRQLIMDCQTAALEHTSRESDETRMVVISTSIKATHVTESSLEEVTQHLDGRMISESKELREKLAETKAAIEKEVRESSATAVGKVLDSLEVEHFVTEMKNEHDGQRIVNVWSPPIPQIQYHIQAPKSKDIISQGQWSMASRELSLHWEPESDKTHPSVNTKQAQPNQYADKRHQPRDRQAETRSLEERWNLQTAPSIRRAPSSDLCGASGSQSRYRPFDQPFGLRIRCIEAIPPANITGLSLLSGRWKPPTQPERFKVIDNARHLDGHDYVSQDTCFVWRPPQAYSPGSQTQPPLTRMKPEEMQLFRLHRVASMFWAIDQGTFLHVPFDCTEQQVEGSLCKDPESDDDERDLDDAQVTNQDTTFPDCPPQQLRETWRRLHFDNHGHDRDTIISIARYTGAHNDLGGTLPERWSSTLVSSVHRAEPKRHSNKTGGLTGDLPLLLGLVAFNEARKYHAITAINRWFPPSQGLTDWKSPTTEGVTEMERSDRRKCNLLKRLLRYEGCRILTLSDIIR
jgi:hypothetical protein